MANRQVCNVLSRHIRSFSSSAPAASSSGAPIQLYGLEGRYAHAIYSAASKKQQLDAVEKDFQGILSLFQQDRKLNDVLKNPLLTREQKQNAVNELGTKRSANALTVNTLSLLAENGRLSRLEGVAKAFQTLMRAHKGEINAKVTTAKQLSQSELKELQAVLQSFLKQGHKLQLETRVDPDVLGGMVIELADRYIDLSLSSKLRTYSNIVKETL